MTAINASREERLNVAIAYGKILAIAEKTSGQDITPLMYSNYTMTPGLVLPRLLEVTKGRDDDAIAHIMADIDPELVGIRLDCAEQSALIVAECKQKSLSDYITPKALALRLGVSINTIERKCRDGQIDGATQVDGRWMIPTAAVSDIKIYEDRRNKTR